MKLNKLRVGGSAGQEDYLYTAGDLVRAQGVVDPAKFYRFVVTDPAGTPRATSSCLPSPANGTVGNSYTVQTGDPVSTTTAWKYQLQQFNSSGCPGPPAKTAQLYFDVAKATVYADSALTMPKSVFTSGTTAYLTLAGVGKVKGSGTNASVGDWSSTWLLPSGVTACANTSGGDRPDSTAAGALPASTLGTDAFLQYRPNLSPGSDSTPWNLEPNFETKPCPDFGAGNQGLWRLRLKRDSTHFVTVPAFTVDTTPPDTKLSGAFPGVTASTSASFDFTSSEAGSSFECRLDAGGWTGCSPPRGYSGLSEGSHTFEVRAIDAAGNVDSTPATTAWTVDTTVPAVTLDNPADGLQTNDSTPHFSGNAGTAPGDSNTVTVDVYNGDSPSGTPVQELTTTRSGGSWGVDASSDLPDGVYTAYARQEDGGPNTGFSAAHTFTVDTVSPHVSLISPAAGSSTDDPTPTFAGGAGTAAGDSDSVTVKLYSGSSAAGSPLETLVATRSGGAWSISAAGALAEGTYTAVATQDDAAGNSGSSSSHTFTVDTTPPTSFIVAGPGSTTSSTSASFRFRASESGATFECRLDGSAWGACSSPKTYSALTSGAHTFDVRAIDAAGNVETDPSTFSWTIDSSLPNVSLDAPADGSSTNDITPMVSGTAGTAAGDSSTVTVKIYRVDGGSEVLVQTRTATRSADGSWSVSASPALSEATYVVHAEQVGSAGTGISASRTFTVDTTAPSTSLTSGPPNATASTVATFAFASSEAGGSFQCRLDGGAWAVCSSPHPYSGLSNGTHTFDVRAIDAAGNVDASPATQSWTVNPDLPGVSLSSPPDGSSTSDVTPAFSGTAGTSAGDSATVTVKVYRPVVGGSDQLVQSRTTTRSSADGSFSVHAFPELAEGPYVVHAEQDGTAGTGTSASRSFTVDTTPPRTSLTLAPQGTTTSTDARFGFSSSEAGSSFECRLDGAAWESCSSPKAYSGLSADSHTFEVRAVDAAGNVDPSPASANWTVDPNAPAISLVTPLDDSWTNDTTPQFSGSASIAAGDSPTVTVEVYQGASTSGEPLETLTTTRSSIDGSWSVYASPALPEATYVAFASQEDSGANVAYSSARSFTVDTSPPQVGLSQPAANGLTNDNTTHLSGAAGTEAGDSSTVTVKLYAGTSASGSPVQTLTPTRSGGSWSVDASTLADGTYTATAQQSDAAGNSSTTPGRTFRVDATAPNTAIGSGPSGTVTSGSATFGFGSSEAGSRLQCRLDGGTWSTCTSPTSYSGLALGTHSFAVRAIDAAGNVDPTPATRSWRVAASPTVAPETTPALTLRLARPARPRLLRRGRLRLFATCNRHCTAALTLRAKIGRKGRARAKRLRLRKLTVHLAAGKRTRLTIKLSRKARRALRRALAAHRRVTVTARGRARDGSDQVSGRLVFRLRR